MIIKEYIGRVNTFVLRRCAMRHFKKLASLLVSLVFILFVQGCGNLLEVCHFGDADYEDCLYKQRHWEQYARIPIAGDACIQSKVGGCYMSGLHFVCEGTPIQLEKNGPTRAMSGALCVALESQWHTSAQLQQAAKDLQDHPAPQSFEPK